MNKMLIELPALIESERLIIRPYRAGDGPAYYEMCQNNKLHLIPFEEGNPALGVNTVEEAEILVRLFAADWVTRSAFFLGAWEKSTGAFAAQIYIGAVDWNLPEFEIGYFVDKAHEKQGFVTEAVKAVLPFVFDCLGAHRVRLGCNEMNTGSYRVAERCGFTREGFIRQTHKHVLREDGTFSGDYLYGLLRSEFEQLYR